MVDRLMASGQNLQRSSGMLTTVQHHPLQLAFRQMIRTRAGHQHATGVQQAHRQCINTAILFYTCLFVLRAFNKRWRIKNDNIEFFGRLTKVAQLLTDVTCLLYTSPSPRDATLSRMPSSA